MAYKKECEICNVSFTHQDPQTKVCGKECRKKRMILAYGRERANKIMSPSTVGAVSEMLIAVDLLSRGYAIFRSLSPSCFCDLIAVKEGRILRVECRTAYKNQLNGTLSFPKKKNGEIDIFGLYVPLSKEIVYLQEDAKTTAEI